MNSAPTLLDMSSDDMCSLVESLGEKPFRAKQLLEWIYRKGETHFEHMTSLSRELREALAEQIRVGGEVEEVVRTDDGKTAKYLFVYDDGSRVEAVSMHEKNRHTVCLSSQVGCAMGCAFCATAGMGFTRNLTAGEMLLQFLTLQREEGHVNNAVFMGMGEPLLNVSSVVKAIEVLTDPKRIGLGTRRITVSTCGIVPGILALATAPKRVRLALSLNSPFDDQRAELMPIDRKYPLLDVIAACESYAKTAGQRVTVEYVLLGGVNTGPGAAKALALIANTLDKKVNLIEYNPNPGAAFESPSTQETLRFREALEKEGLEVAIRFRRGRKIAAGCGQLAGKKQSPKQP